MLTGRLIRFNPNKGFGFIRPDDGSTDIFVDVAAFERAGMYLLDEEKRISFDVSDNVDGRRRAVNLGLAH